MRPQNLLLLMLCHSRLITLAQHLWILSSYSSPSSLNLAMVCRRKPCLLSVDDESMEHD